ncbi:flavin-containing monooxygenase [Geodermatophilus sp. CPCC 206100]|uniref:flavin-containing monooxygenase n=1 Tax=Geodermatophilus sp. CPCC 206100 TaxID=3020054 RepID=UPI003B00255F
MSRSDTSTEHAPGSGVRELDVAIIGAGVSGMYALYRLRGLGLDVRVYDQAGDVGGTWWWNRYPGARVDYPGGPFYCYTFSEELVREWDWTERQPDQPTVLAYLGHVADKFDLRRDIQLRTKVVAARFDEAAQRWFLETSEGERISAQFLIAAVGTLSAPNRPDIPGLDDFAGEVHHTGNWPQDRQVEFAGKRVGVVGTGSSGVQIIPQIAREAASLTVFQRTPQFALPGRNQALDPALVRDSKENWSEVRRQIQEFGRPSSLVPSTRSALEDTEEERQRVFEEAWQKGGVALRDCYRDLVTDPVANGHVAEFVRSKIRETVRDPAVAEKLMPEYYFATKRQVMDEGYYEVYNQDHVTLVDLREEPIETFTPDGVRTAEGEYPLDILVLATGYDAITGALRRINPVGRDGLALEDKWAESSRTYLGLSVVGFPNLFLFHGPGSPSVMFHMFYGAESQGDWMAECITYMREHGMATIEAVPEAEEAWAADVQALASRTLFPQTASWFTGANIPGKPREFMVYLAGPRYHENLREVAANDYEGFVFERARTGADLEPSAVRG